jgi:large conductance mechanosensitive channel
MTSLLKEFKAFAFKGNMIDLAVAVVIGTAFGSVVTSLVKNIFMPLLSYIIPNDAGYRAWHIGRIEIGTFLGELINFIVVALAVFLIIVKLIQLFVRTKDAAATAEPVTKECPFCLSLIPVKAVKCAHCTADLQPHLPRQAVVT